MWDPGSMGNRGFWVERERDERSVSVSMGLIPIESSLTKKI